MRNAAWMIALGVVACGGPSIDMDRDVPAMLEGVDPPPVNEPLIVFGERDQQEAPAPSLARGQPGVLILRDGQPVTGLVRVDGQLTIAAGRMTLTPREGTPLDLQFELPPGMAAAEGEGPGTLDIADFSGPQGADRLIQVLRDGALAFGEVWRRGPEPLTVALGGGLSLRQGPVTDDATGYVEAPTELLWQGRSLGIVGRGEPVTFDAPSGPMVVFLATSHLYRPDREDASEPAEYILHAWLSSGR